MPAREVDAAPNGRAVVVDAEALRSSMVHVTVDALR
jgi:hypothetical protein